MTETGNVVGAKAAVYVLGKGAGQHSGGHQTGILAGHAASSDATVAGEPVTRDEDLEPAR